MVARSIMSSTVFATPTDGSVSIRPATDEDAAFFFQLELQTTWENLPRSCGTKWKRDAVREALCATHHVMLQMPDNAFFIAEVGGERAGLLWFGTRRNPVSGQEEGWIYNVTVCEAFRGRGLAKKLMARAEEHARAQGHSIIGLSVAVHNEIAQELYRAQGYEPSNLTLRKSLSPQPDAHSSECALCREGDN